MNLYTIGFTKTSAEHFFERLRRAGVRRLLDVRLNNVSQLAGFAKRDDLRYFLRVICNCAYEHRPEMAPTKELLDSYRKAGSGWDAYATRFEQLITSRHIERGLSREQLNDAALLCSEEKADNCHRRIVAEYLKASWPDLEVQHL
jgi:uncharacterized protein (DUF488 family)